MALLLLFGLMACSEQGNKDKFYKESDPIRIIDGAGRQVSFAAPVQSVATTWGGTCDPYLFVLGVQDRLVATNASNDFHQLLVPNMDSMKSVGRWSLDKEALAAVSPDLFIHGLGGLEYMKAANKLGIRGIVLSLNSFEDIKNNLTILGASFGVEDRASYVCKYCDELLSLISQHLANLPDSEKKTVVVLGEETGTVASDIYNTMEEMVRCAGGISVVPEDISSKTDYTNVGLETIFKWDADYIFLQSSWGELTEDQIMTDSAWANLTSVKNGNVYTLPSRIDSWATATPSCYLGTLFMSMKMYPDLFSDIDYDQIVVDFYKEVYNVDASGDSFGY